MFDLLREYLGNVMSPEAGDVFLNASKVLEDYGFEEHQHHLAELMSLADNYDSTYLTTSIESTLMRAYYEVIGSFGVYLQEASLTQLTDVFVALNQLGNYGDPQHVIDIIEGTDDAEEAFAEIIAVMTDYEPSELLLITQDVSAAIIRQIVEQMNKLETNLHAELISEEPDDQEFLRYARARLHAYLSLPNNGGLIISKDIAFGMAVLLPFDNYVEQAHSMLNQAGGADQLGRELLAMAYASNLPDEEIMEQISEVLPEFISNIAAISRVEEFIRTEMAAVSRILTS